MDSRAKLLGHAVHPMLIVFPLGLLPVSLVFDLIGLWGGDSRINLAAYWTLSAGIVGALAAAVFGLIDFLAIPARTRARRVGLAHGGGNLLAVAVFAISWSLRREDPAAPGAAAVALSAVGNAMALVTAWLGGELVERLGVGVDDGANLNAPSSLQHERLNLPPGHPSERPSRR